MDINQVIKQMEWVDEERRRDKTVLLNVQERLSTQIDQVEGIHLRFKELEEEVKRLSVLIGRLNQFDGALVQQRVELRRIMDESEKKAAKTREEVERVLRTEIKSVDDKIYQASNKLEQIQELRRDLQNESAERQKVNRSIEEAHLRLEESNRTIEDFGRALKQIEEGRRQDQKQVDGVQGEIITLRKRIDERRSELESLSVNINRMENRINEILSLETSRHTEQQAFIEQQSILQVERDRVLKDWIKKVEAYEKQSQEIEMQIQNLDVTHRAIKRSQEAVDLVTERMERRISEITELQRLTEERFRQEWVTFKGDDQKRWADYTLTQDEKYNELLRMNEKLVSRATQLEDQFYITRELTSQLNNQTEKGLQSLFTIANDWLETYQKVKESQR